MLSATGINTGKCRSWEIVRQSKLETRFSDVKFIDNNTGWIAQWYGIISKTNDGGKNMD